MSQTRAKASKYAINFFLGDNDAQKLIFQKIILVFYLSIFQKYENIKFRTEVQGRNRHFEKFCLLKLKVFFDLVFYFPLIRKFYDNSPSILIG